jgi:hypothetical protein
VCDQRTARDIQALIAPPEARQLPFRLINRLETAFVAVMHTRKWGRHALTDGLPTTRARRQRRSAAVKLYIHGDRAAALLGIMVNTVSLQMIGPHACLRPSSGDRVGERGRDGKTLMTRS